MRNFLYFFALFLLLQPLSIVAQSSATKFLKEEQEKFFHQLDHISIDSAIVQKLSLSVRLEINNIYLFIISEAAVTAAEKEKAIRSLAYFINGLGKNIAQQRSEMYDIPGALESYYRILKGLLYHRSFADALIPMGQRRSQVVAAAFAQYKEYPLLDDIAVYKRV